MKENYRDIYSIWMARPEVDEATRAELSVLADDEEALMDRFGRTVNFGTSGIRGLMRAGMNGINVYTIRRASQGLADIVCLEGRQSDGVVLSYDSRNNSRLFAEETAGVLAANGVNVYMFDELRPTPELSFAVRELGAAAGVNITASHNPKEYNGYKVYWDDGAQIAPEKAAEISGAIAMTDIFDDVKRMSCEEAQKLGLLEYIGAEIDEKYLEAVFEQSVAGKSLEEEGPGFRMVYAAFHGAGAKAVQEVLRRMHLDSVTLVEEQLIPDGNFPTVNNPNPEYLENYELAIKYAEETEADVIIGTDPDSDRCGMIVRTEDGFKALTGNQIGILLLEYLLRRKKELGILPENGAVMKSVVSTSLCAKICDAYGVSLVETLTGFKYIGERIKEYEETGEHSFIFGFEESIGYLAGTYTRDKDAVLAAMLIAEMACDYKSRGMSVYEGLISVYEKYGYSVEKGDRIRVDGYNSLEQMAARMTSLRNNPPEVLGFKVESVRDFAKGVEGFPKTDMLYFMLAEDCEAIARPSGTEPVIKLYVKSSGICAEEAEKKAETVMNALKNSLILVN